MFSILSPSFFIALLAVLMVVLPPTGQAVADDAALPARLTHCMAYVRFVNVSDNMLPGLFFTVQDRREVHVFSATEKRHVGEYIAVEPGYVDLRSYNASGLLETRRTFIAAGSNGYTVVLYDGKDHTDFVIIVDSVRHLTGDRFAGTYYNLSANSTSFTIKKIDERVDDGREVVVAPSVKTMDFYEYGELDFGLYGISSNTLWVRSSVIKSKFFNINERIIADFFIFDKGRDGDHETGTYIDMVESRVGMDSRGCIVLSGVRQ